MPYKTGGIKTIKTFWEKQKQKQKIQRKEIKNMFWQIFR